jgi:hypothetical protein
MTTTLFSILESPRHPDFSALYRRCQLAEVRLTSMRKALGQLKQQPPDIVVAEFFYGYGNNYAGVNISNLDVLLYSLQRYAPAARVIVLVEKAERRYVDKLNDIFPLHAVLQHPVTAAELEPLLPS